MTGTREPEGRTRRAGLRAVALIVAPLVVAALVALAMQLTGDTRRVEVAVALPAAILMLGLLASLVISVPVGMSAAHRRTRRRLASATDAGIAQGAHTERENHRRFLARLDHELKNPVTAIRATAAAAQQGVHAPEAWDVVDDQAAKLSALVRDLRKLAELETRALEKETVDLEVLLSEAISALRSQDPAVGSRLSLTVTRVPWPVPAVQADPDLLALAIDNVLANAAKYSAAGPIEVRLREEDGSAIIEIADTGRGVPAADLPHVFDELARAANARDVGGAGIGLSLVGIVLRRHGGDASLRSSEGAGTVVVLRLPLRATR